MAEFMKNEVPGVSVPDAVIERMSRCDTKESALEEGTAIARELLEALRGTINGVQLSTPLGKPNTRLRSWVADSNRMSVIAVILDSAEIRTILVNPGQSTGRSRYAFPVLGDWHNRARQHSKSGARKTESLLTTL
jgi:hypothetical protein